MIPYGFLHTIKTMMTEWLFGGLIFGTVTYIAISEIKANKFFEEFFERNNKWLKWL